MFTKTETVKAALAAIDAHPDQINPTTGRTRKCRYTSDTDPDHHCIAGQIFVDLGVPLPEPEAGTVNILPELAEHFTDDAFDALFRIQVWADEATRNDEPWRTIRAKVTGLLPEGAA